MTFGTQSIGSTHNKVRVIISILLCGASVASWPLIGDVVAQASADRVVVTATRFAFTPAEITLKQGQPVNLVIVSTDVAHGLRIKELGFELKAAKGQRAETTFTPVKTGDFTGRCSVFCGVGHGRMTLNVHVVK